MTQQNWAGLPREETGRDAILAATQNVVADIGYERLTFESVAARCRTSKTAICLRWPDKTALVAEAVAVAVVRPPRAIHDTGNLREDLLRFADEWHVPDSHRDAVIAGLLTALRHQPDLKEAVIGAITTPGQRAFRLIVQRAVDRGDIAEVDLIGSALLAMVVRHVTALTTPLDRDFINVLVDGLLLPALCGTSPRGHTLLIPPERVETAGRGVTRLTISPITRGKKDLS